MDFLGHNQVAFNSLVSLMNVMTFVVLFSIWVHTSLCWLERRCTVQMNTKEYVNVICSSFPVLLVPVATLIMVICFWFVQGGRYKQLIGMWTAQVPTTDTFRNSFPRKVRTLLFPTYKMDRIPAVGPLWIWAELLLSFTFRLKSKVCCLTVARAWHTLSVCVGTSADALLEDVD